MLNCLLTVGKAKEPFYQKAMEEYLKRLQRFGGSMHLSARPEKEGPSSRAEDLKNKEGLKLLKLIEPADTVWAMCVEGKPLSSEGWARELAKLSSRRLLLVIGGQLGLSRQVSGRAQLQISLGPITLPHELAAVVALEQLYRAYTINAHMPYHRA